MLKSVWTRYHCALTVAIVSAVQAGEQVYSCVLYIFADSSQANLLMLTSDAGSA